MKQLCPCCPAITTKHSHTPFLLLRQHLLRCMAVVCTSSPLGRLWMVLQCAMQEGMGWGVGSRVMCSTSLPERQQGQRRGSCAPALMGMQRQCLLSDRGNCVAKRKDWFHQDSSFSPVLPSTILITHIPASSTIPWPHSTSVSAQEPDSHRFLYFTELPKSQHKEKEVFQLAYLKSY